MRLKKASLIVGCGFGAACLGAAVTLSGDARSGAVAQDNTTVRARAVIAGAPGSGIEGTVEFTERKGNAPEPGVFVVARVSGPTGVLTPGQHGMHIHQVGTCDPETAFESAGGHFDPGPYGNSTPVDANHPFHMGDVPNLIVDANGVGRLSHQTSRITLSPGPLSVFDADGSAVLVHVNEDLGLPGVTGASGGGRIACGVIELVGGE